MTVIPPVARTAYFSHMREIMFAGDEVPLSGQLDYPDLRTPTTGFPLLFTLSHASCNTRSDYAHYADIALDSGYAVFRWDRRGTGRSGAGGRGSVTQDAIAAYKTALNQPQIDRRAVVILAQGAGTGLLGSAFSLFAQVQRPRAALLIANLLDPNAILTLDTTIHIIQSEADWNPWQTYAQEASRAHCAVYDHGASWALIRGCDRLLMATSGGNPELHPDARLDIETWLAHLKA